ncbi:ComEA family DNA-binding protein [Paenibacillus paeoniae]|nr:helix-hairpin-helix domain-containing protein [Paenibacillus paeoniae]
MTIHSTGRKARANKLLAAACGAGAILLIAAGLINGAPKTTEEWVPLNAAVQSSLDALNGTGIPDKSPESIMHKVEQTIQQPNGSEGLREGSDHGILEEESGASAVAPTPAVIPALTSRDEQGRLDLNRATADELLDLKGIGPSKARAIAEDRERNGKFANVDDLIRVKGIGEKLLGGIKESVVARP